ncbi:MAG: hypothetical protein FJW38_21275 [Acidobacteria bacterium]|nr:hypothetical protein [Acidobacteriota bacterium]
MVRYAALSPDSKRVAYLSADGGLMEQTIGGETRKLFSAEPLAPVQWSQDGKRIYVQHVRSTFLPSRVSTLDLATGRLEPWQSFAPADTTGVDLISRVLISPDERQVVFLARRIQSELFVARGLH